MHIAVGGLESSVAVETVPLEAALVLTPILSHKQMEHELSDASNSHLSAIIPGYYILICVLSIVDVHSLTHNSLKHI